MEWSPIEPSSRGGSWVSQWVCRSCSRTLQESDIPPFGAVSCHSCQGPSGVIFDAISGALQHFCFACWQPVVGGLRPWFSQGPLRVFGSLYGWGDSPPSPPGVGTQSWFFCPLISIALGAVELSRGVSMCEFGRRSPVPDGQDSTSSRLAQRLCPALRSVVC